jgi:hypothetical protein
VKIKTENTYPPIPIRDFDSCAYDDNTYDGPGSTIGWGPTEQAAIDDLPEQLAEKALLKHCFNGGVRTQLVQWASSILVCFFWFSRRGGQANVVS